MEYRSKLKLDKDIYVLLTAVIIMHIAAFIVIPVLPIIFKSEKGINPTQIGIIIGLGSIAFQIGNIISGFISDRTGKKITISLGSLIQTAAFIGYGFSDTYNLLLLFSFINGVGGGMTAPTLKAAISELTTDDIDAKTTAFSYRGIAANIGMAIGGLIILLLSVKGSNIIFFISAGIYGLLAIFTLILLPKGCRGGVCPIIPVNRYKEIIKNKPFILFGFLYILFNGIYSLLELMLPLRAEEVLTNPKIVGSIFTIMSVTLILFQGLISKYIIKRYNPLNSIFFSMLFFALGLFLIGNSYTFIFLTVSAVIFNVGQMLMVPTSDSIVSKLADKELVGAYFSVINILFGLGRAGGSFISGKLISIYGIDNITLWLILSIASIVIGIGILISKTVPSIKENIKNE